MPPDVSAICRCYPMLRWKKLENLLKVESFDKKFSE